MIDLEAVRAGLDNGDFFIEYLPIVSLGRECCDGAEALLRWRRAGTVLYPDQFVPLIENTPLSGLVTYWVIDRAALEMGDWLRRHDDVELHINVPPEILGRGGLEYAAQKAGLDDVRHKMVLEITERGVPDQLGLDALDAAARGGVRIAFDDVRIDPASVMVLSRANAQIIKIDKGVLLDHDEGAATPRWAEALSVLLKTTNLEVIAEGVETAELLELLRDTGVRRAQGHYFSRPLAAAEFLQYFARHGCAAPLPKL